MITTAELLFRFTDAADTAAQRAALFDLTKTKQLHRVASDEAFLQSLDRLARSARSPAGEIDRLLTLAALQRAAASARSIQSDVESLLKKCAAGPLSKLYALPDNHDRLYAARTWRVIPDVWHVDDLATAAVREESGEAVRRECIEAVISLTDDFETGIAALRRALLEVSFKTKKPADSLGRRLIRVLAALTATISRSRKSVGANAGREISYLARRGFRTIGRPEATAVREDLVEEIALLTHEIVRADFSHAERGETYAALSGLSLWFGARDWEDVCRSSQAIPRVRDDVQKALVLLASTGKIDNALRSALIVVAGSQKNADTICRRIAVEHAGIPDDVRHWLAGASRRIQSASAVESQERSIDQVLAELLVATAKLSRASATVETDVLPEVSIVLPQSLPALSRLTGLADAMSNSLRLAATWRSLRLRGKAGEEVEFTPLEHQFSTAGVHSRHVRLLSPVVERLTEDGVPRIVLKATVEPAS